MSLDNNYGESKLNSFNKQGILCLLFNISWDFRYNSFAFCSDSGTLFRFLCFDAILLQLKTFIVFCTCISLITSECPITSLSLLLCWRHFKCQWKAVIFVSKICYLRQENTLSRNHKWYSTTNINTYLFLIIFCQITDSGGTLQNFVP